jgi:molybdopterin/thiamine biosynthesis adenylyltransferase
MDTEINGVKLEMKDLNRQIFFFDLEIKRKRKMISKLRSDIEKSKRVAKLKKELNARMGNNEVCWYNVRVYSTSSKFIFLIYRTSCLRWSLTAR